MKKIPNKDLAFVSIQLLLFMGYVLPISFFPIHLNIYIQLLSLAIASLGLFEVVLSIIQLNSSLTPFPTPKENASLITNGIFKYIRHPIYSGIILMTLFYGIYCENFYKILIGILLFIVFYFKSNYEENLLKSKFVSYSNYMSKTKKFIPFVI